MTLRISIVKEEAFPFPPQRKTLCAINSSVCWHYTGSYSEVPQKLIHIPGSHLPCTRAAHRGAHIQAVGFSSLLHFELRDFNATHLRTKTAFRLSFSVTFFKKSTTLKWVSNRKNYQWIRENIYGNNMVWFTGFKGGQKGFGCVGWRNNKTIIAPQLHICHDDRFPYFLVPKQSADLQQDAGRGPT